MDEEKGETERAGRKLAIAASMLLFSSHRLPGVRGWELRRRLGRNYLKIIDALNSKLNSIGLRVKIMFDQPLGGSPAEEDFDRARFFVTLSEPLSVADIVAAGWNIEDVAVLAAALSYLFTKGGRASEKELVELIEVKLPRWKVEAAIERFIRKGYLTRAEDNTIKVGWRALAEVDEKELLKAIMDISPTQQKDGSEGRT
ncbi:MAG: hypothetical protein B9J98_02085 [Candidatus Terraquivivens tikiterensis]|uniref:MAGE domain-containing protein n=1 Tax=Candidatus Terraquivivens tikiterensis TaxID=1980982 RepID=A0A2R7Y888_9ARCH|nr:MAG: hypothetical protein B9J98_02085 [Candidatus Terraquivivens tikiterensis]